VYSLRHDTSCESPITKIHIFSLPEVTQNARGPLAFAVSR